jgi:integrase
MSLTDTAVRLAKPRDRAYRLADARGLCLLIQPTGSKWWRFRYRFQGTEKMLSLGTYPDVSLSEARNRREAARKTLELGTDPSAERKETKVTQKNTFRVVAEHWLAGLARHVRINRRSQNTYRKAKWLLESFIFPDLGGRPIGGITPTELLMVLKKIETAGMHESARRAKQRCGQVFRHAVGLGYPTRDITVDLRGLLEAPVVAHRAAIKDPAEVGVLLRAIEGYGGRQATRLALKLSSLVFLRPGELRRAEWAHINLEEAEWRIPPHIMKMRSQHIVPLSRQAISVLRELQSIGGSGRYVFPALGNPDRFMSENTVNKALRILGYNNDQMTAHGFRSIACTLLNEQHRWTGDAIERQLAHAERDAIRAAYNYADYLPERREMMQAWADYLDELRASRKQPNRKDRMREDAASASSLGVPEQAAQ